MDPDAELDRIFASQCFTGLASTPRCVLPRDRDPVPDSFLPGIPELAALDRFLVARATLGDGAPGEPLAGPAIAAARAAVARARDLQKPAADLQHLLAGPASDESIAPVVVRLAAGILPFCDASAALFSALEGHSAWNQSGPCDDDRYGCSTFLSSVGQAWEKIPLALAVLPGGRWRLARPAIAEEGSWAFRGAARREVELDPGDPAAVAALRGSVADLVRRLVLASLTMAAPLPAG